MLVEDFLLLAILYALFAAAMALGECVIGLHASALVDPLLLTLGSALPGLGYHVLRLHDGIVELAEKYLIVAEDIAGDAVASGIDKAAMVFLAILLQKGQAGSGFLFAGQQFTELARGIFHAQLREVEQGLQREGLGHDGGGIDPVVWVTY